MSDTADLAERITAADIEAWARVERALSGKARTLFSGPAPAADRQPIARIGLRRAISG